MADQALSVSLEVLQNLANLRSESKFHEVADTGIRGELELHASVRMCRLLCVYPHTERFPVATNLALDPELIERALKLSGEKTKKAAVTRALEEFIANRSQKRLADLMGKLEWDRSYDYKAERMRR
jgi:Bacterial antitoxin of type II TA system, VapB